jgi:outer membrane protein TolC
MKSKIILMFLCSAMLGYGQQSFDLASAQAYALEHNMDVNTAKLDERIIEAKIWETTAAGLPQVSAKGEFMNYIDIPTSVLPANAFNPMAPEGELVGLQFGTKYSTTGSVSVSQLIFSGNYLVGLQAVKASSQIYSQMTQKNEIDVKFNVAEAYYTVLILEKNKSILDSTLISMDELLTLTKKLVAEEVMVRTNAYQLELSVLQMQNAIQSISSQQELAKNLLKFQMGFPQEETIEVVGDIDNVSNSDAGAVSVESNIDYKILNTQLSLNELSLKNTKANYLPNLAAFFNFQKQALRNEFDFFEGGKEWYPTTLWGLTLNIPIFSSGERMAQVKQATLEVEKSELSITQFSEALKMQIFQATTNYELAQNKLALQIRSKEFAQKVLDDTQILYKEGTANSIELTQAQSQLLTEQTNYTNAMFELIKAKLALEKLAQ